MQEIQIPPPELIETSKLTVHKTHLNPNKMTREQLDRLKTSIKKFGFIVPIITNKDLVIADGEQRWMVANELAMPKVLIVRLPVEEVDRLLIQQVMNSQAVRGMHDLLLDAMSFENIIDLGKKDDLKYLLDLTDGKLERYLNELHPPKDEDYEVPELDKVQTDIKTGDIIELGSHRLMCGDSSNIEDCKTLIENKPVDMVFTDPPYNVNLTYGEYEDKKSPEEYNKLIEKALTNLNECMQPHASIYCMSGNQFFYEVATAFRKTFRFSSILIWLKQAPLCHGDYQFNYEAILYGWKGDKHYFYGTNYELAAQEYQKATGQSKTPHPAQRPVNLVLKFVQNSSKPKDRVMDLFGGSGSTLMACEQGGRTCYMMEIDPRYCEIIAQRWEKYTGQKRKLVKTG